MRIRIPVLVADGGRWVAYGFPGSDDPAAEDWTVHYDAIAACDGPEIQGYRHVYVTADVPEPELADAEVAAEHAE